jgi:hypothetical protein
MSTLQRDIDIEDIFTDSEYGVEVIIQKFNDRVVLLREQESGEKRLCPREAFTEDSKRFLPKNE